MVREVRSFFAHCGSSTGSIRCDKRCRKLSVSMRYLPNSRPGPTRQISIKEFAQPLYFLRELCSQALRQLCIYGLTRFVTTVVFIHVVCYQALSYPDTHLSWQGHEKLLSQIPYDLAAYLLARINLIPSENVQAPPDLFCACDLQNYTTCGFRFSALLNEQAPEVKLALV